MAAQSEFQSYPHTVDNCSSRPKNSNISYKLGFDIGVISGAWCLVKEVHRASHAVNLEILEWKILRLDLPTTWPRTKTGKAIGRANTIETLVVSLKVALDEIIQNISSHNISLDRLDVIIEEQVGFNMKAKVLAHSMQMYFLRSGINVTFSRITPSEKAGICYKLEELGAKTSNILRQETVSGPEASTISGLGSRAFHGVASSSKRIRYRQNKQLSKRFAQAFLAFFDTPQTKLWKKYFEKIRKSDDLADCLLHCTFSTLRSTFSHMNCLTPAWVESAQAEELLETVTGSSARVKRKRKEHGVR